MRRSDDRSSRHFFLHFEPLNHHRRRRLRRLLCRRNSVSTTWIGPAFFGCRAKLPVPPIIDTNSLGSGAFVTKSKTESRKATRPLHFTT